MEITGLSATIIRKILLEKGYLIIMDGSPSDFFTKMLGFWKPGEDGYVLHFEQIDSNNGSDLLMVYEYDHKTDKSLPIKKSITIEEFLNKFDIDLQFT